MIPLKDDSPSALKPVVTLSLIVGCALTFLWQRSLDAASSRQAVAALGAIPAVLLTDARLPPDWQWIPRFATPLTSMFLHGGWMHLLGNMLFLWIYGDNVEDAMGHARYLGFYLLCGIAALFARPCPTRHRHTPSSAPAAQSPESSAPTCCCFRRRAF